MRLIILILVVLMMRTLSLLLQRDTEIFVPECAVIYDSFLGEGGMLECLSRNKRQSGYNSMPDQIRGPPVCCTYEIL